MKYNKKKHNISYLIFDWHNIREVISSLIYYVFNQIGDKISDEIYNSLFFILFIL